LKGHVTDRPRPFLAVGGDFAIETEGLPLAFVLPVLDLISRMARAPKLSRRAKGEAGMLDVGASPSSKGDSSTVPEFELDMLSVRGRPGVKGDVAFCEPDKPTVVRDRRRCCACMAALEIGPGRV
jgi:hypothetical protein